MNRLPIITTISISCDVKGCASIFVPKKFTTVRKLIEDAVDHGWSEKRRNNKTMYYCPEHEVLRKKNSTRN